MSFKGKDLDRVRYYSTNALAFIKDLEDKLKSIPEDKRNTTKVELNQSMKLQISNTIENLLLSTGYLYDFPNTDSNDILIRMECLFLSGKYEEYLTNLTDEETEGLFNLSLCYSSNLLKYQSIYDIKNTSQSTYSYQEFTCIVDSLKEMFSICLVLLSEGNIDSFLVKNKNEYKNMVNKYTLNSNILY